MERKHVLPSATMAADGDLWTSPMPIGPCHAVLVHIVKSGSISAGTLTLKTGPDSTSLLSVDHANNPIDAHTASVEKYVGNVNKYLQGTISSWSGTGSIEVTVTALSLRTD
jgi:hypothetical protein